jgi:endonuclease YncB( thermonuclease family)
MALPGVVFALALSQPSVVDGDTLGDAAGERYRVENIDAPERGARSACPEERALAEAARAYVEAWISQSDEVEAIPIGRRDRYGRVVARGSRLTASTLVSASWRAASPNPGRKADFCSGAWLLPAAC